MNAALSGTLNCSVSCNSPARMLALLWTGRPPFTFDLDSGSQEPAFFVRLREITF